jgi:hypothetical protein
MIPRDAGRIADVNSYFQEKYSLATSEKALQVFSAKGTNVAMTMQEELATERMVLRVQVNKQPAMKLKSRPGRNGRNGNRATRMPC